MEKMLQYAGRLTGVHTEPLDTGPDFFCSAPATAGLAAEPGTVLLMSGGGLDGARYHILGAWPWFTIAGRGRNMICTAGDRSFSFNADPFETVQQILKRFRLPEGEFPEPLAAGLLGYFAYDLKDALETLPRTSVDDLELPHLYLTAPSVLVVHDRETGHTRLTIPEHEGNLLSSARTIRDRFLAYLNNPPLYSGSFSGDAELSSVFTRETYMEAVRSIRAYIAAGDVYQVNMSQRFEAGFSGDPFALFQALYAMNPAPFFAFVNAGDHQIVSTSPERFIQQQGQRIETRPIKGTRPRGTTEAEDAAYAEELQNSPKDDAELSMIVDLLRNDIGKVCEAGSVRVAEHKRLEPYQNVFHLVSVVTGKLDQGRDSVDLIRAAFPGGSITGCPKIRSMEIIDELEPVRRHIYTGSIGYISFHDTLDLSIAIRTATVCSGRIYFSVGGGIVYDSDPAAEYEETLHKGQTLMSAFRSGDRDEAKEDVSTAWGWENGLLKPLEQIRVPVTSPGFQYGYGFFETIRTVRGHAPHLAVHLERFEGTWRTLFGGDPPDMTWAEVIRQVVEKNGLSGTVAAVKLMAAKGAHHPVLLVLARPYTHRLDVVKQPGLRLAVYPHPRQTPLADHKTLNYLYYLRAGEWARAQGADEALILNPDGSISETSTANLLAVSGDRILLPESPHVLPGVMQNVVCKLLSEMGYRLEQVHLTPEALFSADQVLLTNGLMGAVPVISVNSEPLASPADLWQKINQKVL